MVRYPGRSQGMRKHKPIENLQDLYDRSKLNEETGCIEWQGHIMSVGYGTVYHQGKTRRVHRLSYELHNNKELDKDVFVCHKCDNPSCCNVDHLFEGTPKENTQDMINKGRKKVNPKITFEIAKAIRKYNSENKIYQRDLGKLFGLSQRTIVLVLQNKRFPE